VASSKPQPGKSLSETYPELAKTAFGWDPRTVSWGSSKKVSWICERSHKWFASVKSRSNGSGCPVCSGNTVLVGSNDLATINPVLAAEADGWDPTTVTKGSNKKVGWKCEHGHKWSASVKSRSHGRGCPVCSGNTVLVGSNDLATINPVLAAEADGWDPTTVTANSSGRFGWECSVGHKWKAVVASRFAGRGCPVCAGKEVQVGFNDLATVNPVLAAEADGWDPTTLTAMSGKKVGWKCLHGHKWVAVLASRSNGNGCPVCDGKEVQVGFNDLVTVNPVLAAEADGWDTTTVTKGSNKKVGWKCEHGHKWSASVKSRSHGSGCPVCDGKEVQVGFNDLVTVNPVLAAEADGWDPTTLTPMSGKKVGWKCSLGHKWVAVLASRSNGSGCPVCGNDVVLVGFNDLATINPVLAAEADGWDPTTVTKGSHKKVGWKCAYNHKWETQVGGRSDGDGCPFCSGNALWVGFNDLATVNPVLAAEADGWDPTTVTKGSHKKVGWKCDDGHHWKATVKDRVAGYGCPTCAKFGFDPNKPGWLYFIEHDDLLMLQIGITNFPDDRLGDHKRRNWEVIEIRGPMDGHLTQKLETDCLHALEKRDAILGHKAGIEKFDGYTEAWTKKSLNVTSMKQILDWVYEDESK
jgi:Zn finger protein HypA/HybF involved in hydrogenase expression